MKEKNDILFGFHSVYEALKAGKRNFYNILISKNRSSNRAGKIEDIARKRKIKIEIADPELLDTMTDFSNHQGLVARTSFFPIKKASEVITLVQKKKRTLFYPGTGKH
jgi:23S rRNA (guanosine2251-2'-O)-methyltransferase